MLDKLPLGTSDWLSCQLPWAMLDLLETLPRLATGRKMRLFACALWRRHPTYLTPERLEALSAAENHAEGLLSPSALARFRPLCMGIASGSGFTAARESLRAIGWPLFDFGSPVWNSDLSQREAHDRATGRLACDLLREIIGDPFYPVQLQPVWLAANDGVVLSLASHIKADRAYEEMPILADALEDAGCHDSRLLEHCRGPHLHVPGCWVLDLILRNP